MAKKKPQKRITIPTLVASATPGISAESPSEKWRSPVRGSLITALVGGLVTLACTCAVYLIDTAPAKIDSVSRHDLQEAQDLGGRIERGTQYGRAANSVANRSLERLKKFAPLAKNLRQYEKLTPAMVDELGRIAITSRVETENDKGILSAYAPEVPYSPPETHRIQEKSIADELAMWESLYNLVEAVKRRSGQSTEAAQAFQIWTTAMLEASGDESAKSQNGHNLVSQSQSLQRQADAAQAKSHADFKDVTKHVRLAAVGFAVCVAGLLAVLFLVFDIKSLLFQKK
jgi:hypothetical protein